MQNELKEIIVNLKRKGYSVKETSNLLNIPERTLYDFLSKRTYTTWWKDRDRTEKIMKSSVGLKIVLIPDTQVKPGVPLDHIVAAGNYINKHRPDVVVVIGDWWDMPSLNRFGSNLELDGTRIKEDLDAGKEAMELFLSHALVDEDYEPRLVFTVGNHDPQVRIPRAVSEIPNLEGLLVDDTTEWLEDRGFEVYDFLDIVEIGGLRFSHYFVNPHSAKKSPLGGQIDTMLKNCGFSFVQGHTQGLKMGKHYLGDGSVRLGLLAGSFYMHDEAYMGGQGNTAHWRGIIQLNDVKNGGGDICELSLDYLLRKYS